MEELLQSPQQQAFRVGRFVSIVRLVFVGAVLIVGVYAYWATRRPRDFPLMGDVMLTSMERSVGLPYQDKYIRGSPRHALVENWAKEVFARSSRTVGKPNYKLSFTTSKVQLCIRANDIYMIVEDSAGSVFEMKAQLLAPDREFLERLKETYP